MRNSIELIAIVDQEISLYSVILYICAYLYSIYKYSHEYLYMRVLVFHL